MASHRAAFFWLAVSFLFLAANSSPAATTGSIQFPAATVATVQNLHTRNFPVDRSGGSSGAASAVCSTVNGTAKSGTDFAVATSSVTWANGDSAVKNCAITIYDTTPFSGSKTFVLQLTSVTGASVGSVSKATVTIYGNKGAGAVSLSAANYSVAQNAGSVTISINRSGGAAGSGMVSYATANGSAVAGTNYSSTSGSVSWTNGDASARTITIPVSSSPGFSGSKTFAVALAAPETVVLGTQTSAIVTITGNSGTGSAAPTVSISAAPSTVTAGSSPTLTWSSSNATSCTASGGWSGSVATSGSKTASAISQQTTYTLNCTGAGGSASQSTTVYVSSSSPVSNAPAGACTGNSGALSLKVSTVRSAGISPLLVFFDATATTDGSITRNTTTFQDVIYSWNFGDTGTSGADTWDYGSNPGHNSRDTATGGVAAHLYVTPGSDTAYTVTVTAKDGSNTASCQLAVTAHDPAGSNGFAGNNTTCVSASGNPAPGSGGCPAGAAVLHTSSFNTALNSIGNGKRVIFKCGDSFSGDNATLNGIGWSVGAYGGCENTQNGRPILRDSGTSGELIVASTAGDGRIADLDLEGNGTANSGVTTQTSITRIPYQITLSNLNSNGNNSAFSYSQGAQWGIINSVMTSMRTSIGTFVNFNENNPGTWSGNPFNNVNYQALLGNSFNGAGGTYGVSGEETVRISACRLCVLSNNTFENANNVGATLKLHNGNTNQSSSTWTGVYTELIEISDNWFGGTSGAQVIEHAPQNAGDDERLRNIVFERNYVTGGIVDQGSRLMLVSAVNETLRDNVFYMPGTSSAYPAFGPQIAQRGIEPAPTGIEVYNNTCYAPNSIQGQTCIAVNSVGERTPASKSYFMNNLFYTGASGHETVDNEGSGNAVSNNTATPTNNPGFYNGSGTYKVISDFKPSANYSGGATVPVISDALGVAWAPTWEMGAIHP